MTHRPVAAGTTTGSLHRRRDATAPTATAPTVTAPTVTLLTVVAAAMLLLVTACGGSGDSSSADRSTTTRPSAASTPSKQPGSAADPNATTTIADLGDVKGPVGDCLKLAGKFSNLVQGLLNGGDGASQSQKAALDMKSQLPDRLHSAADVVAATFGAIAVNGGSIDGAQIDTPAYQAAVAALGEYFSHDCRA